MVDILDLEYILNNANILLRCNMYFITFFFSDVTMKFMQEYVLLKIQEKRLAAEDKLSPFDHLYLEMIE